MKKLDILDNPKTLVKGTFDILARDDTDNYIVTITATEGNGKTGNRTYYIDKGQLREPV
jgi:hypothetical protein